MFMSAASHHEGPGERRQEKPDPPIPRKAPPVWIDSFARAFGEDRDTRWGSRLVRLVSDMVLVCDEDLNILYHNRAFLCGVGYQTGTFVGTSLLPFFSENDRPDIENAFGRLLARRSAGMRVHATFMTRKGNRQFDARVTRTRRAKEAFFLYFVIRDETSQVKQIEELEAQTIEPLITGLPVAAFRTDHRLRIIQAYGDLWKDAFRCSPNALVGVDLTKPGCRAGSKFLKQIDFSDTMAGMSFHTDFSHQGKGFEITVEPFLNEKSKIMGSIGMIRMAKKAPASMETGPLAFPNSNSIGKSAYATRALAIEEESLEEGIEHTRDPNFPDDGTGDGFAPESEEDDLLALSN